MDRIGIHVEVPRVEYEKLSGDRLRKPSAAIRGREIVDPSALLRAGLAGSERIETGYLTEAIQYRPRRQS